MTTFSMAAQFILLVIYFATGFKPLLFVTLGLGLYAMTHDD